MAHGFHVVSVRVPDEGAEVARVVLGPQPRRVEDLGPTADGCVEERLHRGPVRRGERDVRLPEAVAGGLRAAGSTQMERGS